MQGSHFIFANTVKIKDSELIVFPGLHVDIAFECLFGLTHAYVIKVHCLIEFILFFEKLGLLLRPEEVIVI